MRESVSPVASAFARDAAKSDVLVADGYGIRIFVNRGHLVVQDGIGRHRRERRHSRATHGLRRVVVLGHSGYVTLEAQRWMADTGIGYIHLETDGRVLNASSFRGVDHPALRRAQACAGREQIGLAITIELLDLKLCGQARTARFLGDEIVASSIDALRSRLASASDTDACRSIEAAAASTYWQDAWATVPISFARRDAAKVPGHWAVFGSRQSALATVTSPRRATNPPNAVLNYLYALGEAEAGLALLTVGLDPGLGFLHVDQKPRDSAALDLLEAIRPDIDTYVLRLIRERSWSRRDFAELRDGTCRILPPVTHELADTMPAWARLLAPIAERVAAFLADSYDRIDQLSTPLTQSNRSAGRRLQRKRPARQRKTEVQLPGATCRTCGTSLHDASRRVCDACLRERRSAAGTIGRRGPKGASTFGELASDRQTRREATIRWEQANPSGSVSHDAFEAEIRAGLAAVPIGRIAAATGLSTSYCARIRNGPVTPHQRHWAALRSLVDANGEDADRK